MTDNQLIKQQKLVDGKAKNVNKIWREVQTSWSHDDYLNSMNKHTCMAWSPGHRLYRFSTGIEISDLE